MMRSPSSASATRTSRSRSDGMTSASTRLHRARVHQRRAAGELRQLAHEAARTVRDDRLIASEHVVLRDRELAAQHDDHAGLVLPRGDDPFTRAVRPRRAEAPQPLDLRGLQHRKHLMVAGFDRRTRHGRHDRSFSMLV